MRRLTHRTTLEILEQKRLLAGDLVRFDTKDDTAAEVRFGDDDGFELVAARRDRSSDDNSDDRDDSDDSSRDDASETLYVAALQGPGPGHGKVEYEVDTDDSPEIEFELEVEDAVPGSSHVVTVDGVTIGTLQINSFGRGDWKLTSRVDDVYEQPLPAKFPALQAGSVITVGSILQGELRQVTATSSSDDGSSTDDSDDRDDSDDSSRDDASETLYVAALQGPGPGHGKVEYEVDTDDSPEIEFELEVEDAVPGSSHVVTVDGVTIGTLQINSFGRGEWKLTSRVDDADEQPLPANFPALQAGSVITVGSILQGELRQRLIAGDMNDDNQLDADDVDSLFAAMRDDRRNDDDRYDIDRNGVLNQSDIARYVQLAFDSVIGDTNLDGVFNSSDLIAIFQLGHYEDEIRGNSGWSSGDWNGDGDCDSSDLVFAFQQGGYRA